MFILECGKNHMGDSNKVRKIVNFFLNSSFDKITFMCQSRDWYQKKIEKGQNFKLPKKLYLKVIRSSHKKKKKVGLSVCDLNTFNDLKDIKFDFYKLLSVSINNNQLIEELIKKNKIIYISTGFNASLSKIKKCLKMFKNYKKIVLLHTPMTNKYKSLKFNKITFFKKKFGLNVGYSNHFSDINTLYALATYKPEIIMLYIKLNKKVKFRYPDHDHAIYLNKLERIKKNYENVLKCHI